MTSNTDRMHILAFAALALSLWAGIAFAAAPSDLVTPESISTQVVSGKESEAPHFITGESLVSLVKGLVPFEVEGSSLLFNRNSGQLFVRHTPSNLEQIEGLLTQLRTASQKQVDIEARIITVSSADFRGFGQDFAGFDITRTYENTAFGTTGRVQTTTPTSELSGIQTDYNTGIDFPTVLDGDNIRGGQFSFFGTSNRINIESAIDALESVGEVNTLSAPRLSVFNNQRANIKVEDARNYLSRVDYELIGERGVTLFVAIVSATAVVDIARSGTILDVTPTINADGTITLDLHPTFVRVDLTKTQTFTNKFTGGAFDNTVTLPVFETQSIDTTLTVPNGGVAVLGGLITETETKDLRKIPLLSEIPILGDKLFQNTQNKQIRSYLVMFVKATIRDAEDQRKAVDAIR